MQNQLRRVLQWLIVVSTVPIIIYGFSAGPPIKRTGAAVDGGLNCTACHNTFAVNPEGGSVTIATASYTPGVKQNITVTVEDPRGQRWGFQLIARLKSDETKQAGTFTFNDDIRVRCDPDGGPAPCNGRLEFASHTQRSTRPGTASPGVFTVEWTPPDQTAGDVIFYAAGNAANNDLRPTGDRIYTTSLSISVAGPPAISQNGVSNAASFQPAVAPNGWIMIKGTQLSANTRTWEARDFISNRLPTQLDGVGVTINGKPAYVFFISPTQLNVLAPPDTAEGNAQVQVNRGGVTSGMVMAQVQKFAPAFFLFPPENNKYIVATHANGTLVGKTSLYPGLSTPARPGETIALWGASFGPTDPPIPDGEPVSRVSNLTNPVTVRFGATLADVSFQGLIPAAAGLYQINVKVPDTTPNGDIAVTAEIQGLRSPDTGMITVERTSPLDPERPNPWDY